MKTVILIVSLHTFLLISCSISTIHHDEGMAARSAEEAAKLAFLEKDFSSLKSYLHPKFMKEHEIDKITMMLQDMHPDGFPTSVRATGFEHMPGQRAMNILLQGKNRDQDFYYRFLMVGTSEDGYKVTGILRGSGPYPKSKFTRPL